ncbi:MAG: zinc ribbon domain-containing protein [Thermoplasmata archaeon]
MATQEVYILLFGAVVLVVIFVGFLLFAIQRLRRRKAQLLSELKDSPRLNSDRAFNRLEMARREAEILARQGTESSRARELIAQSQSALDLRQFDRAYELAQSAHEALVAARQGTTLPAYPASAPVRAGGGPPTTVGTGNPLPSVAAHPAANPPISAPAPARNRMESQFEMRLLDSELETARQSRGSDPATLAGAALQTKAQAAFAAGQYAEALGFALKGRRGLGGKVEAVPPTPGAVTKTREESLDPALAAEKAAGSARCPSCGYPTTADDVFCRGCGAPRVPTACPKCGTPRAPTDTFCGRCAERFS